MTINMTNLSAVLQSKIDALSATSEFKDLLLLAKAIEAAAGNATVSEVLATGTAQVGAVNTAGTNQVQAVNNAAAVKVAAIQALDALLKSGGTLTGPLNGTTINATLMNATVVTADSASPSFYLREADAPTDGKTWEVNAENQVLAFRIWNEAMSAYTSFLKFIRSGVASIYILITTAVRASIIPLTDGATITPNFQVGNVFSVTLGGNRTLANPTNVDANHQGGSIIIRQDSTGNRTLSFGNAWKFPGGVIPGLSPGAGKVDRLQYTVVSPTEIHAVLLKDIR